MGPSHSKLFKLSAERDSIKHKILWTLAAAGLGLAAATHTALAAGDAEAGRTKFHTCVGCHGIPGYSNSFPAYQVPSIGGQRAEYLASVLKSYAGGSRKHSSMSAHAGSMSGQDIQDLAAYISGYKGTPPNVRVKGDAAAGKKNSNLASCAACHGADGNSKDHSNPRLAGQYESFLIKALNDYKTGARKNPIMEGIAQGLSEGDISELAAYFASQPRGLTPVSE